MTQPLPTKQHLLAVLLEDYYHVGAFDYLIQRGQWSRFEARFEHNTIVALDLLDRFQAKVTFFSLGWIAERQPEIIREITRRGHEIAIYSNLDLTRTNPTEFKEDVLRARESLEEAGGKQVLGFRAAQRWQLKNALWALETLAAEGFSYDASIAPTMEVLRSHPERRFAHQLQLGEKQFWEFPVSTFKLPGFLMPIAGGNFFRQFPHTIIKQAVRKWHESFDAPFVMYFHVWELDRLQPRINSASSLAKIRHYRNLGKMYWVIEDYLKKYNFTSFADYLSLDTTPRPDFVKSKSVKSRDIIKVQSSEAAKVPVSIVIPCFNEESSLPYLANTLVSVEETLSDKYRPTFIFVDDCSTDKTNELLKKLFGAKANFTIVRHEKNRGVAAAIMTGIGAAKTEIVCSMDCDCTYDPHELKNMIPLLQTDVSLVTASPYHPEGKVLNVPAWRLTLSKGSSFLYRQVLRQKLATYTSCFRVYRKSAVDKLVIEEDGFLGVAELLGKLDIQRKKIVEYPATLAVRLFGYSKMKLLKTILGHLKLLSRLLKLRLSSRNTISDGSQQKLQIRDVTIK
ncbi:MAG: glycosyltransferase [Acidobacteria bacterium]|nr:glycosyltransferase [Acidobacteriota bacterium]